MHGPSISASDPVQLVVATLDHHEEVDPNGGKMGSKQRRTIFTHRQTIVVYAIMCKNVVVNMNPSSQPCFINHAPTGYMVYARTARLTSETLSACSDGQGQWTRNRGGSRNASARRLYRLRIRDAI